MNQLMIAALFALSVLVPAAARGHEGHSDKVMGTVSSIAGNHVMVKTTAGKTVMVMVDAKTKITRGKETLKADALKVGDRLVAEGPLEKDMLTATAVRLGAANTDGPVATKATEQKAAPAKGADAHAGH